VQRLGVVSPNYFQPVWLMARVGGLLATLHCRPCLTDEASWRVGAASTFLCGHLRIVRSRGPNPLKAARRFVLRLLNVILMFTTESNIVLRW
jgi:hypothetical protein